MIGSIKEKLTIDNYLDSHYIHRRNWIRAAVLGANDSIISVASIAIGVAAASSTRQPIIIAIGNVKRLLLDVYHQLTKEYLQYYLNEFCYKFNRRYFGEAIFDRLLVAAVSDNTDFKSKIYKRTLIADSHLILYDIIT